MKTLRTTEDQFGIVSWQDGLKTPAAKIFWKMGISDRTYFRWKHNAPASVRPS
jgi:hypothetical protein